MKIERYPPVDLRVQPSRETFSTREVSLLSASERLLLNSWLDDWEKKGIQYFLDNRCPNGLVLDRAKQIDIPAEYLDPLAKERMNTMASIAATGYGLLAWMLAVEHKMLSPQKAKGWALQTLNTVANNITQEQSGWMYHFLKADSGQPYPDSEISSVDTVLFLLGALIAGEYFGGKVKKQAKHLFDQVNFPMMLYNDNQAPNKEMFSHGFSLKNGHRNFIQCNWDSYSEGIIIPLLALGATRHSIPDKIWHAGWDRIKNWQYKGLKTFAPLPLFTYFYPLGFFNLKDRKDKQGENFWQEAQKAVIMQLAYCKDHDYPKGSFGLTACDGPYGYTAYAPTTNYQDKIIAPNTILACLPLNEKKVFQWLYKAKQVSLDQYKYGLPGSYAPKSGWIGVASDAIGIDIGSTLLMIDVYRRGLIHKLSHQNSAIRRGLHRAGFL